MALDTVLKRYRIHSTAQITPEIYGKAMKSLKNSPPKGPTTSSAGGMGKPLWGKTFAFPPKGGLANRSFFTGRPLKSGSLLMLHPISFVLFLNILLYRLFIYITDRLAIISSCPEMTIPFLSIFWMSVKYHKRTLAFNKAYGL